MTCATQGIGDFDWDLARGDELAARLGIDRSAYPIVTAPLCAARFAAACARHSPEEVVRQAYAAFLGRAPDDSGLDAFTGKLRRGEISPGGFAYAVMRSGEFQARMGPAGGSGSSPRPARPGATLKVGVVGNCQSTGLAQCIQVMAPGFDVRPVFAWLTRDKVGEVRAILRDCDLVLAHTDDPTYSALEFCPPACRVVFLPRISFPAFHPDVVQVRSGAEPVYSPMARSSRIVYLAYRHGLGIDATVRLFREDVYRALGYLDWWRPSENALAAECEATRFPYGALFERLPRGWCFMYSPIHPKLAVLAAVARTTLRRLGLPVVCQDPDAHLADDLSRVPIWPVYPEIAARLGVPGGLDFKLDVGLGVLDLAEFVRRSFAAYKRHRARTLSLDDPPGSDFEQRFRGILETATATRRDRREPAGHPSSNPYDGLAPYQCWKTGVAGVTPADGDPVVRCRFPIDRRDRVASAGSCFAQHISRELAAHGFHYYVAEPAPTSLPPEAARQAHYGLYSARYGNVYTARQLVQLFDRAHDQFRPIESAWRRPDGRFIDPFRPAIDPAGFGSPDEVAVARAVHLEAVREMFRSLDVLVFTLGLTEAWRSAADGAVFPVAPGVVVGDHEPGRYEFVNFGVADVTADLTAFIDRLGRVNPAARLVLTVSPVPLAATYENRHVVTATAYSKAVLRAAADDVRARHPNVEYFPAYEVITGPFGRGAYFDVKARAVTPAGVGHVMRLFLKHFGSDAGPASDAGMAARLAAGFDVMCDDDPTAAASMLRPAA